MTRLHPRVAAYLILVAAASIVDIRLLVRLMTHAAQNELDSHIPLVGIIVVYLLRANRQPSTVRYATSIGGFAVLTVAALAAFAAAAEWHDTLSENNSLALLTLAFVCSIQAGGFLCLGNGWMKSAAFPMAFLLFLVPMPDQMTQWIEDVSVLGSADVSAALLKATGVPFLRDGTRFVLPGIALEVARECSGIHSTWVLLITSLLAAHMFLTGAWRQAVFVALVIPLGIVRNGVRITVISLLCVHIGPDMIDSPIHHHGGPIFFVLSLSPMFLWLLWLRRLGMNRVSPDRVS